MAVVVVGWVELRETQQKCLPLRSLFPRQITPGGALSLGDKVKDMNQRNQ